MANALGEVPHLLLGERPTTPPRRATRREPRPVRSPCRPSFLAIRVAAPVAVCAQHPPLDGRLKRPAAIRALAFRSVERCIAHLARLPRVRRFEPARPVRFLNLLHPCLREFGRLRHLRLRVTGPERP